MKVKSLVTYANLTEGNIYDVIFEYDTVYEVKCDEEKVFCRPKGLFEIVKK